MIIAICDDSKQIVDTINKYISDYLSKTDLQYEICKFYSGESLIDSSINPDIVFLDVEMEGISGISTAQQLKRKNRKVLIILVTAFSEYLDNAFDLNLCRFVTKPLKRTRIIECLETALRKYKKRGISLKLRYNNEIISVDSSDIIYIGIEDRKVYIHTYDKDIRAQESFSYYLDLLKDYNFVQSHQSYMVNLLYVKSCSLSSVKLVYKNEEQVFNHTVYMSKRKYGTFNKAFKEYLGGIEEEW